MAQSAGSSLMVHARYDPGLGVVCVDLFHYSDGHTVATLRLTPHQAEFMRGELARALADYDLIAEAQREGVR